MPPQIRRPDFNHSLIHLTRERKEYAADADPSTAQPVRIVSAFEVLKEILASGVINGSGNSGFVKGTRRAACFTEVPLSSVHHFASEPDVDPAKYRYYGVALSKRVVFAAGGRPVIYLPDEEGEWIPANQKWRHVRFEHGHVDWTHEREWRIPDQMDLRRTPGIYVIVWSANEGRQVRAMQSPVKDLVRSVLPMEHLTQML